MTKITTEQYTELLKKIDNVIWRDNIRRKKIKALQNNQAVHQSNITRHEEMYKKLRVTEWDDGYEEPYDSSEQENGH